MAITKGEQFAGLTVALITPMRDGEVDYKALEALVDFQVQAGTHCLAPMGTTGECPTVDHEEHERVISTVVQRAAGKIRVMAGTGSNCTREAIRLTHYAAKAGADGALMVGPYYNKPTQEGYYQHFKAVGDAVGLPIVLYNIPGRTASNILPETIARLAEHPAIVAIKEATGLLDQASQIIATTNLTLLSGDDSLTLPLMSVGGRGVVSVVGNIVPQDMLALVKAAMENRYDEARRLHYKLYNLARDLLGIATNPIPLKTAMKLLGRDTGDVRLPLCALDEAGVSRVRQALQSYGLIG